MREGVSATAEHHTACSIATTDSHYNHRHYYHHHCCCCLHTQQLDVHCILNPQPHTPHICCSYIS